MFLQPGGHSLAFWMNLSRGEKHLRPNEIVAGALLCWFKIRSLCPLHGTRTFAASVEEYQTLGNCELGQEGHPANSEFSHQTLAASLYCTNT